jgi:hypothetical protein
MPDGARGVIDDAPFMLFKKLLKLPRLVAVVSNLTGGGCAGAAGVGMKPPIGPFDMKYLQNYVF